MNAIKLADLDEGVGIGVPYIDAREQACDFSCDGLQCVLACPTGALTHDLDYPADTRMGFARMDNPKTCLAAKGLGFKGQVRGPDFKGLLRYDEIDRWDPIPVADHPSIPRAERADLVRRRKHRFGPTRGGARNAPHVLDAGARGDGRAARRRPAATDRGLPRVVA